ncbi:ABC transporter ATP-binding protein [soil metagenome]
MSKPIIKIEDLSKKYRLGTIGSRTLRNDLNRWWASFRGKEDPLSKVDEEPYLPHENMDFWALRNVSFDVQQGEAVGLIGMNGAGKSTLLKILSRITTPTAGEIKADGRIASLLEVGTGFHYELTGRENIFLNGAILGMTKREIRSKLDEIVAFSGVDKYIDTPVKRYSSGMHVRLAFAVAAHLEPEILIVDEVLAVGDAEFQKKCLGKMKEVTGEGKTILFVSHNMQAVKNLCTRAVWLEKGRVKETGDVSTLINKYLAGVHRSELVQSWDSPESAPGNEWIRIKSVELIPHLPEPDSPMDIRTPLTVRFQIWNMAREVSLSVGLHLFSSNGDCIFDVPSPSSRCEPGLIEGECRIPGNFLNDGSYYISLIFMKDTSIQLFYYEDCLSFQIEDYRGDIKWFGKWMGAVRPAFPFRIEQKELVYQG